MSKVEEKMLNMVVDMATYKGRLEAEQERHMKEIAEKNVEIAELKGLLKKKDNRIAELEERLVQQSTSQPKVMVKQYFLLSAPKTYNYVQALDNNGRRFVGHMFHQTLADDTPKSVLMEVDEMTRLDCTDKRLADAMEEVAKKKTTELKVYPQAGSTANVGCDQTHSDFKNYLPGADSVAQQSELESKKSDVTNEL